MNNWRKILYLVLFSPLLFGQLQAQNISINEAGLVPDNSAMLDVSDTSRGVLIPRLSQVQRDAISNPATGLLIFQTDSDSGFYFNQGTPATPIWLRIKTVADTSIWTVSDSTIFYDNGFVGIGNASPTERLQIGKYNNLQSTYLAIKTTGGNLFQAGIKLRHFSEDWGWTLVSDEPNTSFHLIRHINDSVGNKAITVNGFTGNVGINSTNPLGRLHVSTDTANFILYNNTALNGSVLMGEFQGENVSPLLRFSNTNSGNFFNIGLDSNENFTVQPNGSKYFLFNKFGRLTIGSDSASGFALFLTNPTGSHTFNRIYTKQGQAGIWFTNDSASWALFSEQQGGGLLEQGAVGLFGAKGLGLAWTVLDNGNMGIGAISPTELLHLQRSSGDAILLIENPGNTNEARLEFKKFGSFTAAIGFYPGNADLRSRTSSGAITFEPAGTERMRINTNGRVGIGTSPNYPLDVAGDINASGSVRANNVALTSDMRFKTNLVEMKNVLPKVLNLKTIYHHWDTLNYPDRNFPKQQAIGLIAQEIQKDFPQLISKDAQGFFAVDYAKFSAVLLQAIKEQQFLIDQQNQNNEKQQYQIDNLIQEIIELKSSK